MNPKNVNDLDPKLKEAYDRIMGTALTPTTKPEPKHTSPNPEQAQKSQAQAAEPQKQETAQTQNVPLMETSQIFTQNQSSTDSVNSGTPLSQVFNSSGKSSGNVFNQAGSGTKTQKKKLNAVPILLIVGGLIFFVAYGVIWAKAFGLF